MAYKRMYKKALPRVQTSVTISPEFYDLCQEHGIVISEATRVGISVLLAEKGVWEYDNRLNISRLLQESKQKVIDYAKKCNELEEKLEKFKNGK